MIRQDDPEIVLNESSSVPLIDVRSPGEYAQGHIPGAATIPLFDDEQRSIVGTLYVHDGREAAIMKGLDLALPKVNQYLTALRKVAEGKRSLGIYCWRGGLRSAMMAEVFSTAGYEVSILKGGYKSYRRYIRESLAEPLKIVVLGGFTGTGKTELLRAIAESGGQTIDLEALACHKGSVFGALGQYPQPTNEQFENELYTKWSVLDKSKVTWLEDESRMIGRVTLPDPVVSVIDNGLLIQVDLDREIRVNRLVLEYSGYDRRLLAEAINRISGRLGGVRTKEAMKALENERYQDVASVVLEWYDQAYQFSIQRRNCKNVHKVRISGIDVQADAKRILSFYHNISDEQHDIP
jgi:tRNA 2-selenouridine synthase